MKPITTSDDLRHLKDISLLSGVSESNIQSVFDSILVLSYLSIKENKKLYIPYIGEFLIRFREDILTSEGKEASVDIFSDPHPELKRLVGQVEDEKSTGLCDNDAFHLLSNIIKSDFKTKLLEE